MAKGSSRDVEEEETQEGSVAQSSTTVSSLRVLIRAEFRGSNESESSST